MYIYMNKAFMLWDLFGKCPCCFEAEQYYILTYILQDIYLSCLLIVNFVIVINLF